MFKDIKWLRLTPDRPGRGGHKTGFHSFPQQPINDVRVLQGAHVYKGTWRREFDAVEYPGETVPRGRTATYSLHGYVFPSLTNPAASPTIKIFEQNLFGSPPTSSKIDCPTDGTTRASRPTTIVPATFQNINGRCFMADGGGEGMIFDDRTPAIHAQPNQNLGVGTPTQALQNNLNGGISPYGTGYCYNGSYYVNHPNPNNMIGTIDVSDNVAIDFLDPNLGQYTGVVPVAASPTASAVSSNNVPFAAAGVISITSGTSLVTLAGAVWPAGFQYCGLSINFNGYSFVIAEHGPQATAYTIDGTATALSNTQLLILGVYNGPSVANVKYTITGCQFKMPGALPGPPFPSTAKLSTTGTAGYSQTTQANLVQVQLLVVRSNGFFRNLGNISMGPVGGGSPNTVTSGRMNATSTGLFFAPGGVGNSPLISTDVGKTIIVDLAGPAGTMLITSIASIITFSGADLASPSTNAVVNVRVWWGTDFMGCGDAAMAMGSSTLTSASNPFTPGDVGKKIMVAGAGAPGAPGPALYTDIIAFVGTGQVTLGAVNASGGPITGAQAEWGSGTANTTVGPTYAYAWYDPETGHCSNISPLYQVPRPTLQGSYADFANLTPYFQIDAGYISYPDGTPIGRIAPPPDPATGDAIRFSHLLFFRTLSTPGSSTLYPIGSLQPFVGKVHPGLTSSLGSWNPNTLSGWMGLPNNYTPNLPSANTNYWYDFSSDSDLLLSGGFRAPQFTNEKPMVLIRGGSTQPGHPYAMAYWDRRLWIVNVEEPNKIAFSCDDAQCPLGVPEESFPPTNFLRLPSVDGKVVGMRTVGDMLLITTEKWAYIVAGNNESNYRLLKVSSQMPGVGTFQMDEFPTVSGMEGEPVTIFFLGKDRIVYQWTMGAQAIPISQPIQDELDRYLTQGSGPKTLYDGTRLHSASINGRRLLIVGVVDFISLSNIAFIYDVDNQVWSKVLRGDGTKFANLAQPTPMATVYGDPLLTVNEIYSIYTSTPVDGIHCMSWLRDNVATASQVPIIVTFPLNFDGKKTRKELICVNLHATGGTWTVNASVNETAFMASTAGPYPDPLDSIYGSGASPVDGITMQDAVVLVAQFASDSHPIIGYRFQIQITRTDTAPAQIMAIDIGYKDWEDVGEGDA